MYIYLKYVKNITIPKEHLKEAREALIELCHKSNREHKNIFADYSETLDSETILDILDASPWEFHKIENGDIVLSDFCGDELCSCDHWVLVVLAPYIKKMSESEHEEQHIVMSADNSDEQWQWTFEDGKLKRTEGMVIFPECKEHWYWETMEDEEEDEGDNNDTKKN